MLFLALFACSDTEKNDDTDIFAPEDIFCDNFTEEAGIMDITDGGASGSNGRLEAQLIVDSDNPRDKSIIGDATYILESIDVGGGERLGQASPLGQIQVTLGAGAWSIRIVGDTLCTNCYGVDCDSAEELPSDAVEIIEFTIEAEKTHSLCLPIYCE